MTNNDQQWLTLKQFADLVGVSVHTVYKWQAKGQLPPAVRLPNGSLRINSVDLDLWLEQRLVGA